MPEEPEEPGELYYSNSDEVIAYTGIRPADLGLEDDEALAARLVAWLVQAKDLIDRDRNRDYHVETAIPSGIHNIALRLVANMLAQARIRRDTPIVRVDDFAIRMVDDTVFTRAIQTDLRRYPAILPAPRFRIMRIPTGHGHGDESCPR